MFIFLTLIAKILQTITIIYIILAIGLSIFAAYFQYFFRSKVAIKNVLLLFVLRALSLFGLCLLLINPRIEITTTEDIKPVLSVLVDNSLSMKYFGEESTIQEWVTALQADKGLNDRFDIQYYTYGEQVTPLDSLTFDETQTDVSKALKAVQTLHKDRQGAVLLLGDGNQTVGNTYEFLSTSQPIYPVVLGDTTSYKDLSISQLNVNRYSYIKNKFPVEALVYYEGKEPITTRFSIRHKGKVVFSQNVSLSAKNNTKTITANIATTQKGRQYYTASVRKLSDEKNITNNIKNFSVEVIDEQTKVLIASSVLHPDLGVLKKAIESNQQRSVDIKINNFKNIKTSDYQLFVFFQPNNNFNKFFSEIKSNYWVITGAKTSWNFLNNAQPHFRKNAITQTENFFPVYDKGFLTFNQKDIGFDQFPPLLDRFGEIRMEGKSQVLCYQRLAGIVTKQPLLATFEYGVEGKSAALFGEGLWKWRMESYRNTKSFKDFDEFIGNLVQYLASNKKRKRLEVTSESIYTTSSPVQISAFYTDQNYRFDNRATLQLTVTNVDNKFQREFQFSLANNSYQVQVENLPSGTYSYKVSVAGQSIQQYGQFKIIDYQIEEQFTNAALEKLYKLAEKSDGELFFKNQKNTVIQKFKNDSNFYTIQKSAIQEKNLIDWKWILFLIIALLSCEWFIRKYRGKI